MLLSTLVDSGKERLVRFVHAPHERALPLVHPVDQVDDVNEHDVGRIVVDLSMQELLGRITRTGLRQRGQIQRSKERPARISGGAFSTALDINNENMKALARRMSVASGLERPTAPQGYGVNARVDVIGTTNEAKSLYADDVGYEADIYGAVFGADWTAPCGAIIGAAVNIGQADANSVGFANKVENDVDYYGFSVYGAHQVGNVNGMFDIGYTVVKNDLCTTTVLNRYSEKLDADVFTIGFGAEYLAKAGAVNVTPHAGIRFSKIDMDDSRFGTSYDAMNVWQMPLGVTFSAAFEQVGWKLAPMVDLSLVPAFGDKDAVADIAGGVHDAVRVVGTNPIQATLGLTAETGAWTFGVHYGLTAGGDERLNNAFNATARYAF